MRSHATRLAAATILCAGIVGAWIMPSLAGTAPPGNPTPSHPPIPTQLADACKDQLTRPADATIPVGTSTNTIHQTFTTVPVATGPVGVSNNVCKRRAIDIQVPVKPSPSCANCNIPAEISVCAGTFAGGKTGFENFCTVPVGNTPEAKCKTFGHHVEVYKKAAGQTEFVLMKPGKFFYQGFIGSAQCRVAASTYGGTHNHDTAEVQPNVTRPTTGMDVYRVLSNPMFDGNTVPTVVFIEFE
jgi:hypothetical protein